MRSRIRLPRLGIAGKIYLWGLLVLLFAFLLITVSAWVIAGDQARARIEGEIEGGLSSLKATFDSNNQKLQTTGSWLVSQPGFAALVENHDTPGLVNYLKPWLDAGIADTFVVCDSRGTVLARVRTDQAVSSGDSCFSSPELVDGLAGTTSSGIAMDKYGRLQSWLSLPVYANGQTAPLGALSLGFFLDGDFLQRFNLQGLGQVAIVYQDRIAVTSRVDGQGQPQAGWSVPPEVHTAEQNGRPSGPLVLNTVGGQYLFSFRPLEVPANRVVGMYGLGMSLASVQMEQMVLFRAFGIALGLATVAVIVVGYFFARVFVVPIRTLDSAAQTMANGDLSVSVPIPSKDEVGDLAWQLEGMRQQLQQALHISTLEKNRYEAIIRGMGIAAVITDAEQRIVSANPLAETVLCQKRVELVEHLWQDLFMPVTPTDPGLPSFWELGAAGDSATNPVVRGRFRLRAQPQIILGVISTPVVVGDGPAGHVHIIQDISAQENLFQSKDEFMLNVAHELRGPLTSLRSFVDLLSEDYATMSKRDVKLLLQSLQRTVSKFQQLVENLIDIGSVKAGQFQVRPLPNELELLIRDAATQVEPLINANEQTLEIQLQNPSCVVMADRLRVVQVIVNLLTNASKYGPEQQPILICAERDSPFARIQVSDHGPGIAPEDQVHLFERFYRVKRGDEAGMGIGLGLGLAKAIVEAHGGQIGVNSQPGAGSTFWFTLPEVQ